MLELSEDVLKKLIFGSVLKSKQAKIDNSLFFETRFGFSYNFGQLSQLDEKFLC